MAYSGKPPSVPSDPKWFNFFNCTDFPIHRTCTEIFVAMEQLSHSHDGRAYKSTKYQPENPGLNVANDGSMHDASIVPKEFALEGQSRPFSQLRSFRWWLVEILVPLISVASFIATVSVV